jgi:hypothetical protein
VRLWQARGWVLHPGKVPPELLKLMLDDPSIKVLYATACALSKTKGGVGRVQRVAESPKLDADLKDRAIAELVGALGKLDPLRQQMVTNTLKRLAGKQLTTAAEWRKWLESQPKE